MTTMLCKSETMAVALFDPHAFGEAKFFQDLGRFFRSTATESCTTISIWNS